MPPRSPFYRAHTGPFSSAFRPRVSRRRRSRWAVHAGVQGICPARLRDARCRPVLKGTEFDLVIAESPVNFTGKPGVATTINGSLPAPTLRWREGDTVTIRVTNKLREATSIHWHGIILPYQMDGVPGISFNGIAPGETFTYRFKVQQSGSYWYHSHSGFQELTGMYGAIIIDPLAPRPSTPTVTTCCCSRIGPTKTRCGCSPSSSPKATITTTTNLPSSTSSGTPRAKARPLRSTSARCGTRCG